MNKVLIKNYDRFDLFGYYKDDELIYRECDLKRPNIERNARIIHNAEIKIAESEKFPLSPKSPEIDKRIQRTKEKLRKLTPDQVREIKKNIAQGISMRNIAAMYGVCAETIQGIKNGRTYSDIE